MAHAHDGRRDFRRADRVAVQSQLSPCGHWHAADAFVQITSSSICDRFKRRMSMRLDDYDYILPRELIAQRPLERRQDSRMMVLDRAEEKIEHRQFRELKTFLQAGDLLVLNDTRVLAARRFSDNGDIEFLFLERLGPMRWKCMVTPGRKMRVGATAKIDGVGLQVEEITADGERIVAF